MKVIKAYDSKRYIEFRSELPDLNLR